MNVARRAMSIGLWSLTALMVAWTVSGCTSVLEIEELAEDEADAADSPAPRTDAAPPADAYTPFVIRGSAYGVTTAFSLRLEHSNGSAFLSVVEDGPFVFPVWLEAGESYSVRFVDNEAPCVLVGAAGVVGTPDPMIEVVCAGVYLDQITLSGPTASAIAFDPAKTEYAVDISLLQSEVSVIAIPSDPASTITVNGVEVIPGVPSAAIALDLDATSITVAVTPDGGETRRYHVVVRRTVEMTQAAYGKAHNTNGGDGFAYRVALSGDTLAVAAPKEDSTATSVDGNEDDNSAKDSGAVYVFRLTGGTWVQEAYLKASNTEAGDRFGIDVALSGDTIAVGAFREDSASIGADGGEDDNTAKDSGAVYVFRRTDGTWAQEAYLKASNAGAGDDFGWRLALSGDTLAVGAFKEDSATTGVDGDQDDNSASDSGAVYVFRRDEDGWTQEAYLKASNTDRGDNFGVDVALSGDTLAVGAYDEASASTGVDGDQEDNSADGSGAVYVFRRTGDRWVQEAYIKPSNSDVQDRFGEAVSISGDILAVGAFHEDSAATGVDGDQDDNTVPDAGAVYMFRRSNNIWVQEAYLKASNTGANDKFGESVALAGDTLAVGGYGEASEATGIGGDQSSNSAKDSGAVYIFHQTNGRWLQKEYVKATNTGAGDYFGDSIELSGDTLAIGAFGESSSTTGVNGDQSDDSVPNSGAVYIFQ